MIINFLRLHLTYLFLHFINMEHPTYYNKKLDKIIFPADNNEDCKKLIEILSKKYPTYEVPSIVNKHKK